MVKTCWGSVNVLLGDSIADEYAVTASDDGKQVHCYIEAKAGQRYQIRAVTLPFFKASLHVFIDGSLNEGRILCNGLEGKIIGRTVGENRTQPFIFSDAVVRYSDDVDFSANSSYRRAGSICLEFWHVEIVGETKPKDWNALGTQIIVPDGAREPGTLSHTTTFGDKVTDNRVGETVVITKPIFTEPYLVVTFDYMSKELLDKRGFLKARVTEPAVAQASYEEYANSQQLSKPQHMIAPILPPPVTLFNSTHQHQSFQHHPQPILHPSKQLQIPTPPLQHNPHQEILPLHNRKKKVDERLADHLPPSFQSTVVLGVDANSYRHSFAVGQQLDAGQNFVQSFEELPKSG